MEKHSTLFSENKKFTNKITPEDSEENIIFDDVFMSEELKNIFQHVKKALNINENLYIIDSSSSITTSRIMNCVLY